MTGPPTRNRSIACLSTAPWNPYLRLLYGHLATQGFDTVEDPELSLRWLWRARSSVRFLHIHWPEGLYRYQRRPVWLRPLLSRVKLVLFAGRLSAARLLGFRIVWTVHQVLPHESVDLRLDRSAARLLARTADLLVVHDRWTAQQVESELAPHPKQLAVIPHGSYLGIYAQGRPRSEVRSELGLPADAFVFFCFGELRAYKEVELLLAAFSDVSNPNLRLVIAGNVKAPSVGATVRAASARDSRIVSMFGFVPEERVAELFQACDAVVFPRGEAGTSGSLLLALSMARAVVAADVPTVRELTRNGRAGWLFRPHDRSSLRAALESAGADAAVAQARGQFGLEIAVELDWAEIATEFGRLLRLIDGGPARARRRRPSR
jgi:beta-1,4-mannosyltransferase